MNPETAANFDKQRTQVDIDKINVVVIDTFGFLSDSAKDHIVAQAKLLLDGVLKSGDLVALVQIGPERNVRPTHG